MKVDHLLPRISGENMKTIIFLGCLLTFPSYAQVPVCYPGINPLDAYPRFLPVERTITDPANQGYVLATSWTWYCWDGAQWLGYYKVSPAADRTPDWESIAGQVLKDLQDAADKKGFADAMFLKYNATWNCDDQITTNGPYVESCRQARNYMASHFPPLRVVAAPPPSYRVKPLASGGALRTVYPLVNAVRGGSPIPGATATVNLPCDPAVARSPATGTDLYAAFAPLFNPARVALCGSTP